MTPQHTEAAKGPYKAQGDYNILSPNGDVTIFRGTFERDEILRMLNAAWLAGRASAPTVEQIMEVVFEWRANNHNIDVGKHEAVSDAHSRDLRDRLTKLIEGK